MCLSDRASHGLSFPDAVPELSAERVCLRELCERDIPAWFARATDAESADLAGDPIPESLEAGAAWLQRHRDRFRERSAIRWAIFVPGLSESIGSVGVAIKARRPPVGELNIVIARAHWGKGIGTSAARVATRYAFDSLGLEEVQAEVLQRNARSVRLLKRVGFRQLRAVPAGAADDAEACIVYTLLRSGGSGD